MKPTSANRELSDFSSSADLELSDVTSYDLELFDMTSYDLELSVKDFDEFVALELSTLVILV